jgi:hypothetical protein
MVKALFFGIAVLLSGIGSYAQQAKSLQFREEIFDFGSVNEEGGPVVHEFVFTNTSGRPVKIVNVQASCGCTTPGWSKEPVAAGKTGFIQASYNPKGRPGYFNKSLTVTTDLEASPVVLQIKGQVTSGTAEVSADFKNANGNWKLKTASFNMGKVYRKNEATVRDFEVVNSGTKPVSFTGKYTGPAYVKVDVFPKTLAPGAKGNIKVSYNGKLKDAYGFQSDNVEIHTDDELSPIKSFSVYATLEDYFPVLTAEELSKAPQLKLNTSELDFGRARKGVTTIREVPFTNVGKKELVIKSLQGNCTCISAVAGKETIKPGETSTIKISFTPQDRSGTQQKAVTVYTNDPHNPVQRITFTIYVEE